jgi:hypothetical protein
MRPAGCNWQKTAIPRNVKCIQYSIPYRMPKAQQLHTTPKHFQPLKPKISPNYKHYLKASQPIKIKKNPATPPTSV